MRGEKAIPEKPCAKCGTSLVYAKNNLCVECRRIGDENRASSVVGKKREKAVALAKPYLGVRWNKMANGEIAFRAQYETINGVRVHRPISVAVGLTKELAREAAIQRDDNMRKYIAENEMAKDSIRMNFPKVGEIGLDRVLVTE